MADKDFENILEPFYHKTTRKDTRVCSSKYTYVVFALTFGKCCIFTNLVNQ